MRVYDIKKGLKAYANGTIRLVTAISKKKGEEFVEYKVLFHKQSGRIGKIHKVKRASFVKWLDAVKLQKEDFRPGDILMFGDEKIQVVKNEGIHGTIRPYEEEDETLFIDKFYWSGCTDLDCVKIGYSPL